MRIWFTEIGEPLPIEPEVRLYRYGMLTKALVSYGHEVTWWTTNFNHTRKEFLSHSDREVEVDGVRLKILSSLGYRKNISLRRFRHHAHFAKRFSDLAPRERRPDVIITPVPTLEVAEAAVRFGLQHGIPVFTDIRDDWPDEFLNVVPWPIRWIGRRILDGYFQKMQFICRNVRGIMAISNQQLEYGLRFSGRARREDDGVFPLGYSSSKADAEKVAQADAWWKERGVGTGQFVGCVFTSINKRVNLKTVIDSAKILEREFPVKFVLCGDGKQLHELRRYARGANAVVFPGWVNAPQIEALMKMAAVGIAPYARGARMSLPNKPFEYFAGGLPVISSIQGELKDVLQRNHCGLTYQADSVFEFCECVRGLQQNPERRSMMGRNARRVLEEQFSTGIIFERMNRHLERGMSAQAR